MRALLDVNVLLALSDRGHSQYVPARNWWAANEAAGWASCPLTQNGFARVASQSGYERPMPLRVAIAALADQITQSDHEFWPDSISIADAELFDHAYILGPKQITDVYLLALAVKNGGRLVTFDRGLPLKAVRGAEARHLVVL
jgi:toxin-antitoxin system PIN domain toxin